MLHGHHKRSMSRVRQHNRKRQMIWQAEMEKAREEAIRHFNEQMGGRGYVDLDPRTPPPKSWAN